MFYYNYRFCFGGQSCILGLSLGENLVVLVVEVVVVVLIVVVVVAVKVW